MNRSRTLFISILSALLLLAMGTLLVGQSLHIYAHTHHAAHGNECDGQSSDDSGDCQLCHFSIWAVESAPSDLLVISLLVVVIATLFLSRETLTVNTLTQSRAPPASLSLF